MNTITIDTISAVFKRKGYIMTDFNPFGIRRMDNEDLFTDVRGLLRKVNGAWELYQWNATTKPGKSALLKPVNAEGCAILKADQYINTWKLGLHNGHQALVQCGNVKVYRDNHKDGKLYLENEEIAGPASGINLHSVWCKEKMPDGEIKEIIGWDGVYAQVGNWSEGCQVIARPSDNVKFIEMCKASGLLKFTYSLFEDSDLI